MLMPDSRSFYLNLAMNAASASRTCQLVTSPRIACSMWRSTRSTSSADEPQLARGSNDLLGRRQEVAAIVFKTLSELLGSCSCSAVRRLVAAASFRCCSC
jgi:hypothetical protein